MIKLDNKELLYGKVIKQVKGITKIFDNFFEQEKFDHIIEIGTGNGVFSIYLATKAKEMNATFTTFDMKPIIDHTIREKLLKLNINLINKYLPYGVSPLITELLESDKRILLLIDGALKQEPFNFYAQYIKSKDIMMAHDYYLKQEIEEYGTFVIGDVLNSIIDNNLRVKYNELFDKALWLCVTK